MVNCQADWVWMGLCLAIKEQISVAIKNKKNKKKHTRSHNSKVQTTESNLPSHSEDNEEHPHYIFLDHPLHSSIKKLFAYCNYIEIFADIAKIMCFTLP